MKSSSQGVIVAICLFVGLSIVPLNCEGAPTDQKDNLPVDSANVNITISPEKNLATDGKTAEITSPVASPVPPAATISTKAEADPSPSEKPAIIAVTEIPTSQKEPETTPTTTVPDTTPTTTPSTTSSSTSSSSTSSSSTTSTSSTSTSTPSTTTSSTTTTTTTAAPDTTTTSKPPLPPPCRRFDGPSFIGGIVLTLGLLAIGLVAYKFYKARNDRNYHTL